MPRSAAILETGLSPAPGQLNRPLTELVWIAHWHWDILPRDGSRRLTFGVRQSGEAHGEPALDQVHP